MNLKLLLNLEYREIDTAYFISLSFQDNYQKLQIHIGYYML
jgi:hypothetical protein